MGSDLLDKTQKKNFKYQNYLTLTSKIDATIEAFPITTFSMP